MVEWKKNQLVQHAQALEEKLGSKRSEEKVVRLLKNCMVASGQKFTTNYTTVATKLWLKNTQAKENEENMKDLLTKILSCFSDFSDFIAKTENQTLIHSWKKTAEILLIKEIKEIEKIEAGTLEKDEQATEDTDRPSQLLDMDMLNMSRELIKVVHEKARLYLFQAIRTLEGNNNPATSLMMKTIAEIENLQLLFNPQLNTNNDLVDALKRATKLWKK